MCKTGSPNWLERRTFTYTFFFETKPPKKEKPVCYFQNPICLAKQYRSLIDSGEAENQTDLALKLGVSKVHVSRVLSLLKLNDELIDAVEKIGNPMPTRTVTERMLRECLNSPELCKSVLSRLSNCKE